MTQTTFDLITRLKENDQDFEWYPTTSEIIRTLDNYIQPNCSILDIGAGRGDVLKKLTKPKTRYAIEKSQILINELPADVFVVGTDFDRQTLIDKKVDVIFSNPPFSQFVPWASRIIKEADAKSVFLVIPERWADNREIKSALESRKASGRSIGSFSFMDAERKARGIVNLVWVTYPISYSGRTDEERDPFRVWFNDQFPEVEDSKQGQSETEKRDKLHELVSGRNLIETLEMLYVEELSGLIDSFKKISSIPESLLKEVGVNRNAVRESLQLKIKGMKNRYWNELFDNLSQITGRLTTESRKKMLETLTAHTAVDFTTENAYAIVLWAIKNANKYIDAQTVDLFLDLSSTENVTAYKSNIRFVASNRFSWRYAQNEANVPTHYKLEYRIVNEAFAFGGYDFERSRHGGISERAANLLNDICTVGETLGFSIQHKAQEFQWVAGEEVVFLQKDQTEFMRVRAYKKGTVHIKLDKDFMLKFNLSVAKLKRWVSSPEQAAEELKEPKAAVLKAYQTNRHIELSNIKLIGA